MDGIFIMLIGCSTVSTLMYGYLLVRIDQKHNKINLKKNLKRNLKK